MNVSLRPLTPADAEFEYRVVTSVKAIEFAPLEKSRAELEPLLKHQFDAQTSAYRANYQGAEWSVIVHRKADVGRLIVLWGEEEILGVDIVILPEHQGKGIGAAVIRDLLNESERRRLPFRIHVQMMNRARLLYERLGFRISGEIPNYYEMIYSPKSLNEG